MKNIRTFEQFVNESKEETLNEIRSSYSGEDEKIITFMRPFVLKSIESLGFGYKGGSKQYSADISVDEGYQMRSLPENVFAVTPWADGDYWGKRDLKKNAPMFVKDLNDLQKDYTVELVEVYKKKPEIHIKITKK